jgi:N-acetylmuramoyl-L-alanine amidase
MFGAQIHSLRTAFAGILLAMAAPALADTALPLMPAEDDRAVVESAAPAAGLPALVKMVAADGEATLPGDAELDCLATAVWFESRGETLEGQLAVAQAVVNRARSGRWGGKNVCGVIRAPRQFSFVPEQVQRGTATFTTAMAVARVAMMGLWHDIAEGAHSFHAARLKPGWRLTRVAKVGNHVFYR